MWANRQPLRQPFIETADAVLFRQAPVWLLVFVDACTMRWPSAERIRACVLRER
jgi:hypothetical protein